MQQAPLLYGDRRDMIAGNQDTALLKIVALAFMLVDHLGATIFPGVSELRVLGRIAFPLYAWCLVVGCCKTRDIYRYALRMLALAVLSQPIYMMALGHEWTDFNILFSLLTGVIAIGGIRVRRYGSQFWAPALAFALQLRLTMDYGWRGLLFILLLYLARQSKGGLVAAFMAFSLYWGTQYSVVSELFGVQLGFLQWRYVGGMLGSFFRLQGMVWLALPLIAIPTRSGARMPRWVGYALYPLHLIVLIACKLLIGGYDWARIIAPFQ